MKTIAILSYACEDESGVGFMESLIAIVVGGMACLALVGLAVNVIRESKNNEIRDALTYYAAEGMERVRVIAATNYDKIDNVSTGACSRGSVAYGYFKPDELASVPVIVSKEGEFRFIKNDLCSSHEGGTVCEKLALPSGGGQILYRELTFFDRSENGDCNLVQVTVKVGMLANTSDEHARNFVTEVSLDGFITR